MNSLSLTSAVTAIANAIACSQAADELILAASLFVQLGDTLTTISTQKSLCEKRTSPKEE